MTLELYTISGSPYGWRVQLALGHKGIQHELRMLSLSAGDLRKPEYLAVNPRGQVPALVDAGDAVYESLAILAYLEARFPEPRLFGHSPRETAAIWRVISEYTSYLDRAVEQFILPLYSGRADEQIDLVQSAATTIAAELTRFETALARSPWLAGNELSAADLVVLPHLQSILRAAAKPGAQALELGFLPLSPGLATWRARVEALPYYSATVPPHWRT